MLGQGLINSKIHFLKSLWGVEERIFEYKLFNSMMVNGKKMLLKKLWLPLMEERFLELLAEYEVDGFGIRW